MRNRLNPGGLLLAALLAGAPGPAQGQQLPAVPDRVLDSLQAAAMARAIDLPPRLTALDSLNGFGRFVFGTAVGELPEPLTQLQVLRHEQLRFYAPTEAVNIEGLVLPGFTLTAFGGRLARITFGPTSPQYAELLLARLQRRFGPGRNTGYRRYEWRGQVVTLVYEPLVDARRQPPDSPGFTNIRGTAYLSSNALLAEQRQARRTKPPAAR